jgi:hypothetical protein
LLLLLLHCATIVHTYQSLLERGCLGILEEGIILLKSFSIYAAVKQNMASMQHEALELMS